MYTDYKNKKEAKFAITNTSISCGKDLIQY